MDYRLLATAQADEIKEKAEWEIELDRVPLHRRILQLGEFCVSFVLLMGAFRALFMFAYIMSPALHLAWDIESIRYPFMAAALAYMLAIMLQLDAMSTLRWAMSEFDFALAETLTRLPMWYEDVNTHQLRAMLADFLNPVQNAAVPPTPQHAGFEIPQPANNGVPANGAPPESPHVNENVPIHREASGGPQAAASSGMQGLHAVPPKRRPKNIKIVGQSIQRSKSGKSSTQPYAMHSPPRISPYGYNTLTHGRVSSVPKRNAPVASNNGPLHTSGSGAAAQTKVASARPVTLKVPATIKSPGAIWGELEPRLFEYQALVREIQDIKKHWCSFSYDLKPFKARDTLAKARALQATMNGDQELLFVKSRWGSVPMLDPIVATLSDQISFFETRISEASPAATKIPKQYRSDDNPEVVEVEERPANIPFRGKKARLAAEGPDWVHDMHRKIEAEHAAEYWTPERLHLKDVAMADYTPQETVREIDILRPRLRALGREAMALVEAYAGVPAEPWFLERLENVVKANLHIPDLVFDKAGLEARVDRCIIEGGLLSIDVLKRLDRLFPAANETLQHLIALDASTKHSRTLPDVGEDWREQDWLVKNLVDQAQSIIKFLDIIWDYAMKSQRNDLQALRDHFNNMVKDRRRIFYETSDVFYPPALANLHQTAMQVREPVLRMEVVLDRATRETVRRELRADLDDLVKRLENDKLVLSYSRQCQVSGVREAVYTFGGVVARDLQPGRTSSDNFLCGPRALVIFLQAFGALSRGIDAENILLMMYEDFYAKRNTSLPLALGASFYQGVENVLRHG
ncbi:hypothetical protein M409DRAFT_60225 [Zasmidium cellare ATCC 36951]|uniref:Uncharacterized protein n=1 Tax=Zasmidium cellare ATCC 36951 TaxID=1080233 RepID=A0A6A6C3Z5_ZASCE|nr:uncharacterized protein M409DRAFT_60225 [Zasmidium cellare ATCC 36951]KAF2160116.1 hypothetical protein M409DRAFT_60225 [Zasmidium cellare ATCC 36951]